MTTDTHHVRPRLSDVIRRDDVVQRRRHAIIRVHTNRFRRHHLRQPSTETYSQHLVSTDKKQDAFEQCWAHSPLRAAARPNFTLPFTRCRYCRTPPLSHAACASMSTTTTTTTTTTTRDRGERYGPTELAQQGSPASHNLLHEGLVQSWRAPSFMTGRNQYHTQQGASECIYDAAVND